MAKFWKHPTIGAVVKLQQGRTDEVALGVSTKKLARELAKDLLGVSEFGRALAEGLEFVESDAEAQVPSEVDKLRADVARLTSENEQLAARLRSNAS